MAEAEALIFFMIWEEVEETAETGRRRTFSAEIVLEEEAGVCCHRSEAVEAVESWLNIYGIGGYKMRIVELAAAVEAGVAESRLIRKPLIFCARSCSGYGCSFTQKMDSFSHSKTAFLNEKRHTLMWYYKNHVKHVILQCFRFLTLKVWRWKFYILVWMNWKLRDETWKFFQVFRVETHKKVCGNYSARQKHGNTLSKRR